MDKVVKENPVPKEDKVDIPSDGSFTSDYDKANMTSDGTTNPGEMHEEEKEFPLPSDCCFTPDHHTAKIRPGRFDHPESFKGYGSQKRPEKDLKYSTTSDEYGWYPPNQDTFPTESSS